MTTFSELKLDPKVLEAVLETGYDTPTPIQEQAIPSALEGRDVLGIAQTGTGKTASFMLPLITRLSRGRARARMPRSLVLAPTRELAAQVAESFDTYAAKTKLTRALLIGGVAFGEQDKLIDRGVDVLIATPGRLLDHFERGKLLLQGVQVMVVDEADRMLDMGFIPDIERIFQLTPFTRQTLFFSATMAPEIERITNTFLQAPVKVEVARQATASETIAQELVEVTPPRRDRAGTEKRKVLRRIIEDEGDALRNAIIFCNRKVDVNTVAKALKAAGLDAAPIHGDLDQAVRTRTLDGFREGRLKLLIASEVAARGLDVPAVSHVFNFDVPSHAEDYVHRIGRTGRAGLEGKAITLFVPGDEKYLDAIEKLLEKPLPRRAPETATPSAEMSSGEAPTTDTPHADTGETPAPKRRARRGGAKRSQAKDTPAHENTAQPADMAPAGDSATSEADATQPDDAPQRETAPADSRAEAAGTRSRRAGVGKGKAAAAASKGQKDCVVGMGDHVPDFLTRSFVPGEKDD